jgi:hypothetical protein
MKYERLGLVSLFDLFVLFSYRLVINALIEDCFIVCIDIFVEVIILALFADERAELRITWVWLVCMIPLSSYKLWLVN